MCVGKREEQERLLRKKNKRENGKVGRWRGLGHLIAFI